MHTVCPNKRENLIILRFILRYQFVFTFQQLSSLRVHSTRESVNIFTEDGNNDPKDIYDLKIRSSISRVCPLFEALLNNQIYIKPAAETFQG